MIQIPAGLRGLNPARRRGDMLTLTNNQLSSLQYKVFTLARVEDQYLQNVLDDYALQGWFLLNVVTNTFSDQGIVRSTTTLVFARVDSGRVART